MCFQKTDNVVMEESPHDGFIFPAQIVFGRKVRVVLKVNVFAESKKPAKWGTIFRRQLVGK